MTDSSDNNIFTADEKEKISDFEAQYRDSEIAGRSAAAYALG